uniref:Calcium channel, voltage-dependent, T type, alpha 1G subunit n=1 Tax=Astyanax mexicanus TaxID=7994 RepID=A0A8B9KNH3_ASTMX
MAEDGGNICEDHTDREAEGRSSLPRTFIRLNDLSGGGEHAEQEGAEQGAERRESAADTVAEEVTEEAASNNGEEALPYPSLAPVVFFYLKQTTRPRSWCLKMVCNPYPFIPNPECNMLVILLNCVTLGMFHPCEDSDCDSERCKILEDFDDFIFAFFAIEMVIKMVALGIFGKKCYLGDTWNRLDFFIVLAGMLEYSLNLQNVSFSAVRTVRVLRPLRAINRVPSMRILVTLLLDTLPMLGNVLLLCFFVFFIFGIVGVQLWAGLLRNRCFLPENFSLPQTLDLHTYYHTENDDESPFICSQPRENGMRQCSSIPMLLEETVQCHLDMGAYNTTDNTTCVNWNQYYTNCSAGEVNPFKGAINFDNIGYAWIAIFQVTFYFPHQCWEIIIFAHKGLVGSFFMINLCLVVIATQFSETKQRESQLMKEQRVRFMSNASTLASFSEPGSCYDELLKYLVYIVRKGTRQLGHLVRAAARRAAAPPAPSPASTSHQTPPTPPSACKFPRKFSNTNCSGTNLDVSLAFDPETCPYCTKAAANDSEGTEANETADSDSEGVYEFTQDAHYRDNRDPNKKRKFKLGARAAKVVHFWRLVCDTFRKIVDSKYFGRGIMIAILINTLSMGIEYHEQPEELTNALEISNIVFTSLFALEMLLKLLVYGPFGYIKNPYNIFDGIIVVISVWEIVGQQGGGLSVLRTFRLMRVLKLVRFMPALQRQLVVLMKTMDNVATFCMLLMLFIFIFSILGMHLFGCKFGSERDGDTLPDRKNFDSLLWAIVTVFQILTQEDWNKVLYNGMASTSPVAALYFIALMTFGNYVLFNLLVAILVEGFQTEVGWWSLCITSPHDYSSIPSSLPFYHNCSNSLFTRSVPFFIIIIIFLFLEPTSPALSCCYLQSSARSSPHAPWSSGSSWNSRRSSWNSLGRAPSLKRQKHQSGERRSLLSGDGQSSSDEDGGRVGGGASEGDDASLSRTDSFGQRPRHRRMESLETRSSFDLPPDALQVPYLHRSASIHSTRPPNLLSNGKSSPTGATTQLSLDDHHSEDDNPDEEGNLVRIITEYLFRVTCNKIITHKMFDHVVLVIIFLNCITIAMERPRIESRSAERIFLTLSNYIFTAIFVTEMTIKVVALGWCFGEKCYLKSSWNILDGMLVMISVIDILVSLISNSGTKILGMLRVLRLLRTLRPLRYSDLQIHLFWKFFVCQGEDIRNITNKSDCLLAKYKWVRHKYNFDNLGQALMSLFVLASKDGWVDIMYDGLDAVGVDQQPIMNYNPWMLLYFISFLLIVAFFVLNMFVGVVVENFHKCRRHQEAEEAKRREEKRLKRMEKKRRKAQSKPYYSDYSPTRRLIHKMCTSHYLDLFITIVIGLNVITMSMEHYQQPRVLDEALKICNYIFTVIFVLESVFKLVAFGFRRFFKDRWNQLDLAIVLLSIMGITLEEIEVNASLPINPTIIRIMRVLRIARVLKLLKMAVGMRALLDTVIQALPQVGYISTDSFVTLAVCITVCDELHPCEGLGRYATFKNFGMAFLLLFRVSTGDNWNGIMKDTLRDCAQETGTCYNTVVSPIYFVSFVLTAQFVLVNVVIAVLMKHLEESNKEAKEEADMEAELELEAVGGDGGLMSGGHISPPVIGDIVGPRGSPWISRGSQDRGYPTDSPPADIRRDSAAHIKTDPPLECLGPPLERRPMFDSVSLVIQGSLEGELSLMDNLSDSICHYYALPPLPSKHSTDKQVNSSPVPPLPLMKYFILLCMSLDSLCLSLWNTLLVIHYLNSSLAYFRT